MKIRCGGSRKDGSILLLLVAGTLAVVVLGTIIYNIYRWAVRVSDGAPVNRPAPYTNGPNSGIPTPGNPGDITSLWWENVSVKWCVDEESATIASAPMPPSPKTNVIIHAHLDGDNLLLNLNTQILTNENETMTFTELGMPVDAYGMPSDLTWSYGPKPDGSLPAENWQLERSSNYVDWEPVVLMQVRPMLTNIVSDLFTDGLRYYRAVRR